MSVDTITRTAILIELTTKERILIDCGPDIREQLLKREQLLNELNELKKKEAKLKPFDILLISHEHTDHINGLDELQAFRRTIGKEKFEPIPMYATEEAWNEISKRFGYLEGSILDKMTIYPGISISDLPKEMRTKGIEIIPFKTYHGRTAKGSVGFIIMAEKKKIIYTSDIWDTVRDYRIYKPDTPNLLIMEANWFKEPEVQPANPHMSFERALKLIEEWNPKKTYLVHMSHEEGLTHEEWINHVKERAEGYFKRDIDVNVSILRWRSNIFMSFIMSLMIIKRFCSVFGNKVKLTQSGIDHMLKRHPELNELNLVEEIGLAIKDPDYIVQGKFGRHIAVRIQPQMIGKAKYMVVIYDEKNEEVITSFITSNLERIIRREILWRRH